MSQTSQWQEQCIVRSSIRENVRVGYAKARLLARQEILVSGNKRDQATISDSSGVASRNASAPHVLVIADMVHDSDRVGSSKSSLLVCLNVGCASHPRISHGRGP